MTFNKQTILAATIFGLIILLLAIKSVGFLHPDEHYQVIEYMNVFMGRFDSSILSKLEWDAMMRPWFQPILFSIPVKFIRSLAGGPEPFFEASMLRQLVAALGLFWIISLLRRSLPFFFRQGQERQTQMRFWNSLLVMSFLIPWFVAFLSVRTSSDTLGAHLFMIGLISLGLPLEIRDQRLRPLYVFTVLCGLSLLVRYQMVVWVGVSYLFFLFKSRFPKHHVITAGLLCLSFLGLEFPFNYLGRGLWYSSTFNHINLNLFHGVADSFGTLPWWGYIKILFKEGLPPLCLFYFYVFFRAQVKGRGGLIAISSLVGLIFFSLIGHKEARFLTPTLFMLSLMLAQFGVALKPRLVQFIGGLNLLLTVALCFKPAYRPVVIYEAIDRIYEPGDFIYVMKDRKGRELSFELYHYQRLPWQVSSYQGAETTGLVVSASYAQYEALKGRGCELYDLSYPEWLLTNNSFGWRERSNIWGVWRCK